MKSLLYLNKYFFKYKWHLISGILFIAISNAFSILPAQIIRFAFDLVKETIIQYRVLDEFSIQDDFYKVLSRILLLFGGLVRVEH